MLLEVLSGIWVVGVLAIIGFLAWPNDDLDRKKPKTEWLQLAPFIVLWPLSAILMVIVVNRFVRDEYDE